MVKKYQDIYDALLKRIQEGELRPGHKIPSEILLSQEYEVSRPTINKALAQLEEDQYLTRRGRAGTFVTSKVIPARKLGLLIPLLGTREIFEPICARIAQLSNRFDFTLLWSGSHANSEEKLKHEIFLSCKKYIEQGVEGVFFVPLEFSEQSMEINKTIISMLEEAHIKIVLLDSDFVPFPQRSNYDLIGIDNFQCGYIACTHYLEQGAKRVDFFQRSHSAFTVNMRERGYKAALIDAGITPNGAWSHHGDPEDLSFVQTILDEGGANFICGNDVTAICLMHSVTLLHYAIPGQVRFIGFDDVKFVQYASVPLTTFKQYCDDMGFYAVNTMIMGLDHPQSHRLTLQASTELKVRESSLIPNPIPPEKE